MKGLNDLMQQAQQMQEKMQQLQEDLARREVSGESGGGLVKVIMTGRHDLRKVEIDDSLLQEEKSLLEDLIAAAVNDAVRRIEDANKESIGALTGGIQLPPGFKFPF